MKLCQNLDNNIIHVCVLDFKDIFYTHDFIGYGILFSLTNFFLIYIKSLK